MTLRAVALLILAARGVAVFGMVTPAAAYPPCSYNNSAANYTLYPDILFYVAADGIALRLDAYVPNFVTSPPVLEMIHGGGFVSGSRSDKSLQAAYFANQGFAVVNIDYRLVTRSTLPQYFSIQVPDARCALRWAIANAARFGWDETKLGVTGLSDGPTIAADVGLTGSRTVSLDGSTKLDAPTCPFGMASYSVQGLNLYYGEFDFAVRRGDRSGSDFTQATLSVDQAISPLSYVTPASPPAFLENGSKDTTVLPEQSHEMADVLTAMNVANLYFELQGEGHNFAPQEQGGPGLQAAPWCRNVFWLHKKLGG